MPPFKSRFDKEAEAKKRRAMVTTFAIVIASIGGGWWYLTERSERLSLNEQLCPPEPVSYSVMLVDVTDPMNLPQRQDLLNKFQELEDSIPRYGKLAIFKVAPANDKLLSPVIEICNPGTAKDVTELTGDQKDMQARWEQKFDAPLHQAFQQLTQASGSDTSPILQSIQSVTLTEFRKADAEGKPRRLIVVSDLLQNTSGMSFYGQLPTADRVIASPEFQSARTDLRGVNVDLWMLERADSSRTQPRALADLWDNLITQQKGNLTSVYRVSG